MIYKIERGSLLLAQFQYHYRGADREVQRCVVLTRARWNGKLAGLASRRSASQTLITDCRVTPSLLASRSRESIIQVGKSTFTRFCSCSTRFALDKSKEAVRSTPSSNCCSNFLARITCHLFCTRATNGYQSYIGLTVGNDGRPMRAIYQPDHQKPRFIIGFRRDFQQHRVIPECLCRHKIDTVLRTIGFTLRGVKLKGKHGI